MPYTLTRHQLYLDLHEAYLDARRHKRSKTYQQEFERDIYWQLEYLCEELFTRTYKPHPSTCFIIEDPKKREIVAAEFRDRIVHHLFYNYTYPLFQRTFIQDCYSCIKGRGTHYGIQRLEKHILQESCNYSPPCYVLKMDIKGYFMSISRQRLLEICRESLHTMMSHRIHKDSEETWGDHLDISFIDYLAELIITLDPTEDCRCIGWPRDWEGLPESKSLFHSAPGTGLPIGNLTSQLFSNVYMNVFDQWMKREMHCRHYGRYVDDYYVVSTDKDWLRSLIPSTRIFLREELGLTVNEGKTQISDVRYGVSYLGAYLKPWRKYVSSQSMQRMIKHIRQLRYEVLTMENDNLSQDVIADKIQHSLNSFLGVMGHYNSFRRREKLFLDSNMLAFARIYGSFDRNISKFVPYANDNR